MVDDSGQEEKEQDPVEAIRTSLNKALGFLKQLLGQEEKELKEEMQEVETDQPGSGPAPVPSDQASGDQPESGGGAGGD